MADHYSGEDPGLGFFYLLIVIGVLAIVFWGLFFAAVFDWGPFA